MTTPQLTMGFPRRSLGALTALATAAGAQSLDSLCTAATVKDALPADGTLLGIDLIPSSVVASPVYNATVGGGGGMGGGPSSTDDDTAETYDYCNITVSYTHTGKGDTVVLNYALPAPADFRSRFYVGGGGGFSLSSDSTGGLPYGAASGATDAGYDAFSTSYDEVVLLGNGTVDWDATHMFGHQALGEMTVVGKAMVRGFYPSVAAADDDDAKIYTYFEGCSDGGREGMSQAQRWGSEYDGIVAGAPAFRFAQQQVHHVFSSAVEKTLSYYPPPCELDRIVNATIAACDPLDGREDGVISRTDLCQLRFDLKETIGLPYSCAASNSSSLGFGFSKRQAGGAPGSTVSYEPAQNGTVSAEGVAVAKAIYDGLHDSQGQRAYLSWQVGSELSDAAPAWDSDAKEWTLSIPSTGGEYVAKFVQLLDLDNLQDLDGVDYDTLVGWMNTGMTRYMDTLQTTLPDLTEFKEAGGKLLHYHGESDPSIPAASSVHYWQSVRGAMYPGGKESSSLEEMSAWYQFYLVPGAAHCGANSLQPGPYPQTNMEVMIDWVEKGKAPERLPAEVSDGDFAGETQELCQWPRRQLWREGGDGFDCVEDEESVQDWTYEFPAFKVPVF